MVLDLSARSDYEFISMDRPMPDLSFRLMELFFLVRDFIRPRGKILAETGLKAGFMVLDFGCGPGSYSIAAARLAGPSGKVFALDIHPLALARVRRRAAKAGLKNIETISSDAATGLPDSRVDLVLLYDILHMLGDPDGVLGELCRVLKPDGRLSVSDHHMTINDIISKVTASGLFRHAGGGRHTRTFMK